MSITKYRNFTVYVGKSLQHLKERDKERDTIKILFSDGTTNITYGGETLKITFKAEKMKSLVSVKGSIGEDKLSM